MSSKKEVVKNNPKSQSNKSTNDNALTITVTEEQIEFCRYMNTYKAYTCWKSSSPLCTFLIFISMTAAKDGYMISNSFMEVM